MRSYISVAVALAFIFSSIPLPLFAQQASKPYLAVMDLQLDEGLPKNLGQALSDRMREVIMSTKKYVLIDRGNIEIIMSEIALGQSGCVDDACAVEAGRMLSAHFIITGRVVMLSEDSCQISAQMTDVAKAEIVQASSDRSDCSGPGLASAAENVALDLAGVPRTPAKLVIQSQPGEAIVYVDGERRGTTPANVEVRPGRHKVMVTRRGYEIEEQTINAAPGASMSLNFSLTKAKKKWYQTWWFYSSVGVVLAGGVAGAFIAGSSGSGTPTPTTGTAVINLSSP